MRRKQKKALTFGDFITAAYQVWGVDQAATMVRQAIKAGVVVFREHPDFLFSSAKGRYL